MFKNTDINCLEIDIPSWKVKRKTAESSLLDLNTGKMKQSWSDSGTSSQDLKQECNSFEIKNEDRS